jgi:ribosomal protein S18 acetylase RimI-like enzyme
VAQIGASLVGYVVGTTNSHEFAKWMTTDWLPVVRGRIPTDSEPSSAHESWLRNQVQDPQPVPTFAAEYPAHLHINLLPQARGTGIGRMLVESLFDRLTESDIPGIHLGVARTNSPAVGFYRALGFDTVLAEDPGALFLGRKLGATPTNHPTISV